MLEYIDNEENDDGSGGDTTVVCWKVDYEEEDRLMMEVMVCGEVDRPDSSAYANAQGVPLAS